MSTGAANSGLDPEPSLWPVLVTGGGGFVGGHIARQLAAAGHQVRALTRRPPPVEESDPPIDWIVGDLRDQAVRRRALEAVRGVIHTASWVSLGPDRLGISHATNVDATAQLLAESAESGAERFVYTSSLYSLAAGTREQPADESSAWNLERFDSAYMRTKRQAEQLVLAANGPRLSTIALCPGMVQGPRDTKPTSTKIAKAYCALARGDHPAGRDSDYRRECPGIGPSPRLDPRRWRPALCGRGALLELRRTLRPRGFIDRTSEVEGATSRSAGAIDCHGGCRDRPSGPILVSGRFTSARRRRVPSAVHSRRPRRSLLRSRASASRRIDRQKPVRAVGTFGRPINFCTEVHHGGFSNVSWPRMDPRSTIGPCQ